MLAAGLLRLPGVRNDVSDDREHPESDGLDALASGLQANETDEADEELDLASLAAVTGARATSAGEQEAPKADAAPAAVVAPAPPPSGRSMVVPALLVLAIGIGVGGYLLGRSARPADQAEAPRPVAPAASPSAAMPAPPQAAPAVVAVAEAPAPSAPAPQPAVSSESPVEGRSRQARPSDSSAKPVAVAAAPPAPVAGPAEPVVTEPVDKPSEAPAAALAKAEPVSRSMDQLLDDALSGGGERRVADTAAPAALPDAPSRDEVTQAMAVLLPAIRGCAMGQTGLATAGIVVRGDGRVASVELSGAPFEGTASGRCMEGVLRRARFSRFRQPTFRVRFPFAIQ